MGEEITIPKAWVTKHALSGIVLILENVEVVPGSVGILRRRQGCSWEEYFDLGAWHTTEADAIAEVERMKEARITHLESELARTRALDPAKVVREAK